MCPLDIPISLQGLSIVEQQLISRSRWYGMIVKLSSTSRNPKINYFHLQGNVIVVPLKATKLSEILPSPILRLTENIKVVWVGKKKPSEKTLLHALRVRKTRVVSALRDLARFHSDYADIQIDHMELSTWPNESFVPSGLLDTITMVDPDQDKEERSGYAPGTGESHQIPTETDDDVTEKEVSEESLDLENFEDPYENLEVSLQLLVITIYGSQFVFH
jgi:hypothetical protein